MDLTPQDRTQLRKFDHLISTVRGATDPNIPTHAVQAILAVALNEGKTLTEMAEVLGANLSTASRHLLDLGDRNRKMEPGHGLVTSKTDPMNLRIKRFQLTPKGKLLIQNLLKILAD